VSGNNSNAFIELRQEAISRGINIIVTSLLLRLICMFYIQYVDLILFEERTIINVNPTYSFLCSIFPRVGLFYELFLEINYCCHYCSAA
jgi:hypothetical protein